MKRIIFHGNYKNKLLYLMIKFNMLKDKEIKLRNNFKILKEDSLF